MGSRLWKLGPTNPYTLCLTHTTRLLWYFNRRHINSHDIFPWWIHVRLPRTNIVRGENFENIYEEMGNEIIKITNPYTLCLSHTTHLLGYFNRRHINSHGIGP